MPNMPIPPILAPEHVCPRCGGDVPVPGRRGAYNGAISRTDNATEICSRCGDHESVQDTHDELTPQSDWPFTFTVHSATPVDLMVGTRDWKLGPPMRKPAYPEAMPDLRHNLMDGWAKWWSNPFESAAAITELKDASLWWVGEEMCDLLYSTMDRVPPETEIANLVVPERFGLVYVSREWSGVCDAQTGDPGGNVNAIVWGDNVRIGPEQIPSLSVSCYRYLDFEAGPSKWDQALAAGFGYADNDQAMRDQLAAMGAPSKLAQRGHRTWRST